MAVAVDNRQSVRELDLGSSKLVDVAPIAENYGAKLLRRQEDFDKFREAKNGLGTELVGRVAAFPHEIRAIPHLLGYIWKQLHREPHRLVKDFQVTNIRSATNDHCVRALILSGLGAANTHCDAAIFGIKGADISYYSGFDYTTLDGDVLRDAQEITRLLIEEEIQLSQMGLPPKITIPLCHSRGALVAANVRAELIRLGYGYLIPAMVGITPLMTGARDLAYFVGEKSRVISDIQQLKRGSTAMNWHKDLTNDQLQNNFLIQTRMGDMYVDIINSIMTEFGKTTGTVIAPPGFYPHHAAVMNPESPLLLIAIDILNAIIRAVNAAYSAQKS